jgi:amino acid transporter
MSGRYERAGGSGTSWTSVLIGWLAALGASLILSSIVTAVVGVILTALGFGGGAEAGTTGLVGVLLMLFLAFLIGGYTAGRMSGRDGSKHGLLVALVALIVTLILALLGGVAGLGLINNLQGVTLPGVPTEITQSGLGTVLTLGGVIALLLPFVAGALGGSWGTKTGRRRP